MHGDQSGERREHRQQRQATDQQPSVGNCTGVDMTRGAYCLDGYAPGLGASPVPRSPRSSHVVERLTVPDATVVTGGAGWLGRALLQEFASEPDGRWRREGALRVLVHDAADTAAVHAVAPQAEVLVGDVADDASLGGLFAGLEGAVDVIHTAGVIHPRKVAEFDAVNARGTRNVVDRAARAGVRRFVHVSSNSPFGVNPEPAEIFRNDEPYHPYLGYGRSKMEGELAVRAAAGRDGLETVIVRPPWFYGPYQPLRQTTFFKMVRTGKFPIFGAGDQRRSMGYVGNLVQGVVLAELTAGVAGRGYWIADARPYTVAEIVDTVGQALREEGFEVSSRRMRVPSMIGTVAEKADRLLQGRGIYHQQVHVLGEMNKTIACDISVARAELGYEPEVELLEGMRRSIRWCREQGVEL